MTNINFDQIRIIDTLKYYPQSLSVLASTSTMTEQEKQSIKDECEAFVKDDKKLGKTFYKCSIENCE